MSCNWLRLVEFPLLSSIALWGMTSRQYLHLHVWIRKFQIYSFTKKSKILTKHHLDTMQLCTQPKGTCSNWKTPKKPSSLEPYLTLFAYVVMLISHLLTDIPRLDGHPVHLSSEMDPYWGTAPALSGFLFVPPFWHFLKESESQHQSPEYRLTMKGWCSDGEMASGPRQLQ